MITKQAFLSLAAVDDDCAAELEKVAINWGGMRQRLRSGWNSFKNKFGPGPTPAQPYVEPPHPGMRPLDSGGMRREKAFQEARKSFGQFVDNKIRSGVGHAGTFLSNAVTGGQFRQGLNQMRQGLGVPGKSPLNQNLFNEGLVNIAKGAGKTGLLYGGLGYGGYRMLRNGSADAPIAQMYHQAMPY